MGYNGYGEILCHYIFMFMVATSVGLRLGPEHTINIKGIFVALNVISICWCQDEVLYPGCVVENVPIFCFSFCPNAIKVRVAVTQHCTTFGK